MKQSGKVALGGILGALSLVCMLLTLFPFGTYALPAIAGAVLIPVVIEAGVGTAWMVYGAVALLSLIITPDMEAKVLFVTFFGYYPVLKSQLERMKKYWIEWLIKLGVFNVTMVASYLLMLFVFGLETDTFEIAGFNLPLVFLLVGNVIFVIYDLALTNVISGYFRSIHPRILRVIPRNWR